MIELVEFQDSIDFVYTGSMNIKEFHANADELLKNGMEANAQSSRDEYQTRDARLAELRVLVESNMQS